MTDAHIQSLSVTDYTKEFASGNKHSCCRDDSACHGNSYNSSLYGWGSVTDTVNADGHALASISLSVSTSEGGDQEGSVNASVTVTAVLTDGTSVNIGSLSKGYSHNWTTTSKTVSLKNIGNIDHLDVKMSTSHNGSCERAKISYTVYDYLTSWEY